MNGGFALSGAAAGVDDELTELLKQKFIEMMGRRQLEQGDRRLGQEDRSLDMQGGRDALAAELGRRRLTVDEGGLKLGQDRHGEDVRQFDALAPDRQSDRSYKGALTGELIRKPTAEREGRDHDVSMANLEGTIQGRLIGQRGAEDRRTLNQRQTAAPAQADATATYVGERTNRVRQSLDTLAKKVGPWTTGAGSLLTSIPATEARDFKADLDALKANIAFGELAEMRAASKTGGALGAVSEKELTLLESALGALDQGQSGANFAKNLKMIAESLDRWEQAKGGGQGGGRGAAPQAAPNAAAGRAAELLKKYGG